MRKKRWSGRLILPLCATVVVVVTIVLGIVFRFTIPDRGLAGVKTVADLQALGYAWGDNEPGLSIILDGMFGAVNGPEAAPIVVVGRSTGKLQVSYGSLGQEVKVKEVLRGKETLSEGETYYIYDYSGLSYGAEGIENIYLTNPMLPENDYLIFLETSPLNEYMKTPVYLCGQLFLPYIRLNGESAEEIEEALEVLGY